MIAWEPRKRKDDKSLMAEISLWFFALSEGAGIWVPNTLYLSVMSSVTGVEKEKK